MLERPWGVTILGALFAVNGALQFLLFFLAFSSEFWCAVPLLLSILSCVVAFGLFLGEEWAWKLTLVVDVIYIVLTIGLFALHNAVSHLGVAFLFWSVYPAYFWLLSIIPIDPYTPTDTILAPLLILPAIPIIYLMLPHVKAFFLGTESPIQKPARGVHSLII